MTNTTTNTDTEILARLSEIRAILIQELPAAFVELETERRDGYIWNVEGWGWGGPFGNVRLYANYLRFGLGLSGKITLEINQLHAGGNTYPSKEYTLADTGSNGVLPSNWREQLDKAIALAKKRAALAAQEVAEQAAQDAAYHAHRQKLADAVAAADLPEACFQDGMLRIVTPRLVDDELRLKLTDWLFADAATAARLYAVLGGNLKITVDASLTPEQWLAVRDIFEREYTSA